jgi:hypothetical protein
MLSAPAYLFGRLGPAVSSPVCDLSQKTVATAGFMTFKAV